VLGYRARHYLNKPLIFSWEEKVKGKNILLRLCVSTCLVAGLWLFGSTNALADTIKLKDGSVYKGKVTSYNQRKFIIIIYVGSSSSQHAIPVDEIESVEFDANDTGAPRAGSPIANTESNAARPEKPRSEVPRDSTPVLRPADPPGPLAKEPSTTAPSNNEIRTSSSGEAPSLMAEKTVSVAAAADWTSTEIRVQRGQRVAITASGEVDLGNNQRSGPNGISFNDSRKLMLNRPTGALIAVIGDDNDDFVLVGVGGEFVAAHNGVLFLSINEGNLKDNNGSFTAKVKVFNK
jgi:hypothetical protein